MTVSRFASHNLVGVYLQDSMLVIVVRIQLRPHFTLTHAHARNSFAKERFHCRLAITYCAASAQPVLQMLVEPTLRARTRWNDGDRNPVVAVSLRDTQLEIPAEGDISLVALSCSSVRHLSS